MMLCLISDMINHFRLIIFYVDFKYPIGLFCLTLSELIKSGVEFWCVVGSHTDLLNQELYLIITLSIKQYISIIQIGMSLYTMQDSLFATYL